MERKIGEIFGFGGEWYQCIVGCHCPDCAFCNNNCEERERITLGNKLTKEETTGFCTPEFREDGKSVIFKKLEKVGEPYQYIDGIYQEYKATLPFFIRDATYIETGDGFAIKIKQNKEDMEEKNDVKQTPLEKLVIDFFNNRVSDIEFEKRVSELYAKHSNSENIGKNMREFNLEAAKAGKPVCTRDGRKARIICFDAKRKDEKSIIALVPSKDYPGFEDLIAYPNNGNYYGGHENDGDLMMIPEKKEGWVNIVRGSDGKSHMGRGIFQSKEEAEDAIKAFSDNLIDTVKIFWEE